ncbi:MAG TPA: leucyl/phenylalanyl-tRNA--protein transferase, partial [Polyangiaceae bacterium]|nr:leucyl/phenylalanyl-tRNA--protein transferase [Polyangiaceae bacterium]
MRRLRGRSPVLLLPGGPITFPDPDEADDEGLLAIGGDLSVPRLLAAYDRGIFPWYDEGVPPLWWSPNPRMVFEPPRAHVSRSLRRVLSQRRFEVTWNREFERVMRECGVREAGTWILPEMIDAYVALHHEGHAFSIEVWDDGALVGGLYGVQRGAFFAAESMFHRKTDASKVALVYATASLFSAGIELMDVQLWTPHLESMGARELPRTEYLRRVRELSQKPV